MGLFSLCHMEQHAIDRSVPRNKRPEDPETQRFVFYRKLLTHFRTAPSSKPPSLGIRDTVESAANVRSFARTIKVGDCLDQYAVMMRWVL